MFNAYLCFEFSLFTERGIYNYSLLTRINNLNLLQYSSIKTINSSLFMDYYVISKEKIIKNVLFNIWSFILQKVNTHIEIAASMLKLSFKINRTIT